MPAQPLSTADKQKIIAFITSKTPNASCGFCGSKQLSIMDHLLIPMTSDKHMNIDIGGPPLYPHVGVSCDVCATTTLVSVVPMGIVTKGASAPAPE